MENIKFKKFLENAQLLNERFGIIPLLYGSLGLEEVAEYHLNQADVDILIPEEFVTGEKWPELIEFLESQGYTIIDEQEHTFIKDDTEHSYAPIENLKPVADIDPADIAIYEKDGVKYKQLSLYQYLKVYEGFSQEGYPVSVLNKKP